MDSGLWSVFDYEVNQLIAMSDLLRVDNPIRRLISKEIENAIVESALIHTRILAGFFVDPHSFQSPKVDLLREVYGRNEDNMSPRSIINKRFAHATRFRSTSHDYTLVLEALFPLLNDLIKELNLHRPAQ